MESYQQRARKLKMLILELNFNVTKNCQDTFKYKMLTLGKYT